MAYEDYDYSGIEQQLKARAQQKGLAYDPSDLEGIKRNASYTDASGAFTGTSPEDSLKNAFANYDQRATNTPGGGQQVQYATPTQAWNAQPAAPQSGMQGDLYKLLMERAQQGTAVGRDNPNVRAQVDPVVAQQERANRNTLDDIAEKAGPLANLTGERRLMGERTGQFAGALESEIIGREIDAKRQEIEQAIQILMADGQFDKARALQLQLAQMQDARAAAGQALQSRGLDLNNDQFLRELALREYDTNQGWDYRWATLGA